MRRALLPLIAAFALVLAVGCPPRDPNPPPPDDDGNGKTTAPPPKIPEALRPRIEQAIDNVRSRDLSTTHAFWTIFHGILGLGPDVDLVDPLTKKRVNALDYICAGGNIRGLEIVKTEHGIDVVTQAGTGVGQGHQDQMVAEMVQWGVSPDRKVTVDGKNYTFADFFHHSKMRASVTRHEDKSKNQELSWAIIIISTHFGTDHQWTNAAGEKVSLEDIVRYELDEPIADAACGGTHRLFGLTWAYHLHRAKGKPATGVWKDVADKIDRYKKQAREFQNRADGAFSTQYVSKAEHLPELTARIATTGHVLEWLALALTDAELRQPWMEDAASALAKMILDNQNNPIDGGALYHATHGLYIYRARVFGVPGPAGLTIPPPPK